MYLPLLPVWIIDLLGSALMIGFSFLSVRLARRLRGEDQNNVVWTYLLWLCYGLAAFAVSRSVGHIAKRFLLSTHYEQVWSFPAALQWIHQYPDVRGGGLDHAVFRAHLGDLPSRSWETSRRFRKPTKNCFS